MAVVVEAGLSRAVRAALAVVHLLPASSSPQARGYQAWVVVLVVVLMAVAVMVMAVEAGLHPQPSLGH